MDTWSHSADLALPLDLFGLIVYGYISKLKKNEGMGPKKVIQSPMLLHYLHPPCHCVDLGQLEMHGHDSQVSSRPRR